MNKKKLSKSMLMSYDAQSRFGCPYRYWLTYVKGIRSKPTKVMFEGIKYHKEAAKFYDKVDLSKVDGVKFQDVYVYFRSLYPPRNKAYDHLATLEADRYLVSAEHFIPKLVEKTIETEDRKGIVDRVEELDEGELMICELKLSKKRKESMDDVRFELVFYADLLRKHEYNVMYTSVFFGRSNHYEMFKLVDSDFDIMEDRVQKILEGIRKKEFEPVLDNKCLYCTFQAHCLENEPIEGV